MRTSKNDLKEPRATKVKVSRQALAVDLADGRTLVVPIAWYPRLLHGTPAERNHWRLIGRGAGIHWPDLDEDISVEGLLAGLPSAESRRSFEGWLAGRTGKRDKAAARKAGAGQVREKPGGSTPASPASGRLRRKSRPARRQ